MRQRKVAASPRWDEGLVYVLDALRGSTSSCGATRPQQTPLAMKGRYGIASQVFDRGRAAEFESVRHRDCLGQ